METNWLDAHDGPKLLVAMATALAGDARISFEGDFSRCKLLDLPDASCDQTAVLRRHTMWPVEDFVVLPLEPGTVRTILNRVLSKDRVPKGRTARVPRDIVHVQIEKQGELQFSAYDQFHPDCVSCGAAVPVSLLEGLV